MFPVKHQSLKGDFPLLCFWEFCMRLHLVGYASYFLWSIWPPKSHMVWVITMPFTTKSIMSSILAPKNDLDYSHLFTVWWGNDPIPISTHTHIYIYISIYIYIYIQPSILKWLIYFLNLHFPDPFWSAHSPGSRFQGLGAQLIGRVLSILSPLNCTPYCAYSHL